MKANKRGLSNIVATVLIVLLALAAVAIVWGFLRPMFEVGSQRAELTSRCFNVEVEPIRCTYTNVVDNASIVQVSLANARYKQGEISSIVGVIKKTDGTTVKKIELKGDKIPSIGGTVEFTEWGDISVGESAPSTTEGYKVLDVLTVAGVVSDGKGTEEVCTGRDVKCIYVEGCTGHQDLCGECLNETDCSNAAGSACEWIEGACKPKS